MHSEPIRAVESIAEFLRSPEDAFRNRTDFFTPGRTLLVFLGAHVGVFVGIFAHLNRRPPPLEFAFLCAVTAPGILLIFLLKSLIIHASATKMGGTGTFLGLIERLGYCVTPFYFFLPAALMVSPMGNGALIAFALILAAWSARLGLAALRAHYGLNGWQAVSAAASPAVFLWMLLALAVFAAWVLAMALAASAVLKLLS